MLAVSWTSVHTYRDSGICLGLSMITAVMEMDILASIMLSSASQSLFLVFPLRIWLPTVSSAQFIVDGSIHVILLPRNSSSALRNLQASSDLLHHGKGGLL
jgi:hypothetical protein